MADSQHWRLKLASQGGSWNTPLTSRDVAIPYVRVLPPIPVQLSGLVPNRDHNAELLTALRTAPRALGGQQPSFGIFAADPFLRPAALSSEVLRIGRCRVINFPTVAQFGLSFSETAGSVEQGVASELHNLDAFKHAGCDIGIALCDAENLTVALALDPTYVMVCPSYDDWTGSHVDPASLLQRCRALADRIPETVPIVLMSADMSISHNHATDAGATTLIEY